jgi:hypothetical protein
MRNVFIHIPKCGGNTVSGKLTMPHTRIEPNSAIVPIDGMVTGHVTVEKFFDGINTSFFTVIRHPLERAISHYNYNRWKGLGGLDCTAEEFIDSLPENYMSRFIVGDMIMNLDVSSEEKTRLAMEFILSKYSFIGSIDYVSEIDFFLYKKFNIYSALPLHKNKNTSTEKVVSVSSSATLKFLKKNPVDFNIYNIVGKGFLNF